MSEESIYDLVPPPEYVVPKSPMYRSKYSPNIPPTASTFGRTTVGQAKVSNVAGYVDDGAPHVKPGARFGPKETHFSDPANHTLRNTRPELPPPTRFQYSDQEVRKPGVPRANERPAMSKSNPRNFIVENALTAIAAEPKRRQESKMDYTKKPDFGKTPTYLNDVKQEIAAEREYIRQLMAREQAEELAKQPRMRRLTDQERETMLFGLKARWEQVNKQYQTCTHIVNLDTFGKIRRKEQYETELSQLEKSIEKLSKKHVFVPDDGSSASDYSGMMATNSTASHFEI